MLNVELVQRERQFRGKGSTIKHSKNSSATSTNASSSKIKIPAAFHEEIAEYQRKPLTGNIIIDMEVILNLFLQLCCPRCFEEGILLSEDSTYGLCSNFVIRCKHCDFYSGFSSSKKTLNCPEVNTRFVYGMRQIGKGFSAGFKLCGTLNLPRLSKTAYTNHENKLMSVISEVSELSMQKAASELLVLHPTNNKIVECGISVDGTWQRRGYSSMNGCVAALSVDTGKVVEIEIMSSYCPTCRKISKMPRSIESETFAADHVCHSNFQGSALKMEAVGATRIFQRSIVKRGLKYAHYYGDRDSKGFISVKDTYGKDSVTKYECIGHVQKSSNVGNLSGLQQNVIAALFHCSSSVKKPMHGQCPIGKDSWCYYQRALSCGKKPNEKYKGLSNEVLNTIKPTYLELCTKELLTKCLHGKTQNSNECLNGVIWQRVPKEVFVCLKILKSGALDAVIQFNDGYKGSDTPNNAISICKDIAHVLSTRGFHLRKWNSNSTEFLAQFSEHSSHDTQAEFSKDSNESSKVLGLFWNSSNDTFGFQPSFELTPPLTKRRILSESSKIFDPLGLLSACTVFMKIFYQKLWFTKTDWDSTIPQQLTKDWLRFQKAFNEINYLTVPRWVILTADNTVELHGFADAASLAYAAAIYCRRKHNGKIKVQLLVSKTTVVPVKQVSIPRLQLRGTHLISKLVETPLRLSPWTPRLI
ncbi:uncharacterized protein TNCV_4003251 [Trichonephila clavipes]|nr:uncharacterized protein TNCV_4003251 [Trichonephila clavipes]